MEKTISFQQYVLEKSIDPNRNYDEIFDSAWGNTPKGIKAKRNKKISKGLTVCVVFVGGTYLLYTSWQFALISHFINLVVKGGPHLIDGTRKITQVLSDKTNILPLEQADTIINLLK